MNVNKLKNVRRSRRKHATRRRIFGTPSRPRLCVYRSSRHLYAQIIDDTAGHTLCAASTKEKGATSEHGGNCEAAKAVGQIITDRAKQAGIEQVSFDRNGFRYHGRIKTFADAAREAGLKF